MPVLCKSPHYYITCSFIMLCKITSTYWCIVPICRTNTEAWDFWHTVAKYWRTGSKVTSQPGRLSCCQLDGLYFARQTLSPFTILQKLITGLRYYWWSCCLIARKSSCFEWRSSRLGMVPYKIPTDFIRTALQQAIRLPMRALQKSQTTPCMYSR